MALLLAGVLLGVLFGVLLNKLFGGGANGNGIKAENESLKVELETLRSQVDGHFATSAVMFQNLTEEYRKLLEHMSAGARSLEVELPVQMLADFSTAPLLPHPEDESADEMPVAEASDNAEPDEDSEEVPQADEPAADSEQPKTSL